jgi:hypothetical protein
VDLAARRRWLDTSTVRFVWPGRGAGPAASAPLGIEPVGRLVEDQRLGVGGHGRGKGEPLAHAEGESADPAVRGVGEIHLFQSRLHQAEGPPPAPVGGRGRSAAGWMPEASTAVPT